MKLNPLTHVAHLAPQFVLGLQNWFVQVEDRERKIEENGFIHFWWDSMSALLEREQNGEVSYNDTEGEPSCQIDSN